MTDQDEIVTELRVIQSVVAQCSAGICALLFLIFLAVGPCRPPPPPPEAQPRVLDLPQTPVSAAASRDSSYGPCRREPAYKTLAQTSERPRPGRYHRAIPERISLVSRGPGWGPWLSVALEET